jgi:hypothetical protein
MFAEVKSRRGKKPSSGLVVFSGPCDVEIVLKSSTRSPLELEIDERAIREMESARVSVVGRAGEFSA